MIVEACSGPSLDTTLDQLHQLDAGLGMRYESRRISGWYGRQTAGWYITQSQYGHQIQLCLDPHTPCSYSEHPQKQNKTRICHYIILHQTHC